MRKSPFLFLFFCLFFGNCQRSNDAAIVDDLQSKLAAVQLELSKAKTSLAEQQSTSKYPLVHLVYFN